MPKIVQKENPVLREIAKMVDFKEFGSIQLKKILVDMKSALEKEEDGVAIAAPQIGVSLRIFVVSHRVFEMTKTTPADETGTKQKFQDMIFINPEITKLSKEKKMVEEGCLSVRWLYGLVPRSTKTTVKAYDEHGKKFTLGASGLLAQVFQHEVDHLDGILFIDTAKNLEEIIPEKPNTNI